MRAARALPFLLLPAILASAAPSAPPPQARLARHFPLPAATRAVLPLGDALLVGTDRGLFTAERAGQSTPVLGGDVTALARDASDGRIVAAVGDVLLESADGGASFRPVAEPLPAGESVVALAAAGGRLVAGAARGGILLHDSAGWRVVVDGLPRATGSGRAVVVQALASPLQDPDVLVGVTETARVVRSADGGATWGLLETGAGPPNAFRAGVARLADGGPLAPRTLFMARPVAVHADLVHWVLMRSDDLGESWRLGGDLDELQARVLWVRASSAQRDLVEVATGDEILPVTTW